MNIELLDTQLIHKNDEFEYSVSPDIKIKHLPNILDQGERIGVYARCIIDGREYIEVLPQKKVYEIRDLSSKSKFWEEKNDPNGWMWRKTAIKQMAKKVPASNLLSLTLKITLSLFAVLKSLSI